MKQKVAAFFFVFCLFSSFTVGNVSADHANHDVYGTTSKGPGGPVEIMPPQY